jgi:hypothetical protein
MTLDRSQLAPLLFGLLCSLATGALAQQRTPRSSSHAPMGPRAQPAHLQPTHVTQPIRTAPALVRPGTGASSNLVLQSGPTGGAIPASATVSSGAAIGPAASRSAVIGAPPPGSMIHQPAPRQPLSDGVAPGNVRITIRAISAAGQGLAAQTLDIDGRLSPIGKDLRSFADQFSYRNYRLLDVQTFDLDFRSIAQMELPGQRAIAVEPRQLAEDGRVKVHLELLGQHPEHAPRMRADYSISRGATIFVGGYKIAPEGGTLLLAITQDE